MIRYYTMDITQSKLTRTEWNGIELAVSSREKDILKLKDQPAI